MVFKLYSFYVIMFQLSCEDDVDFQGRKVRKILVTMGKVNSSKMGFKEQNIV